MRFRATVGGLWQWCVADGGSPRTASLFATYLPQAVHSVDAAMHARYTEGDTVSPQLLAASKKGTLSANACTIEEWVRHLPPPGPDLDMVCVIAGKTLLTPARYSICECEMTVELSVVNVYQCIRTRYSRTYVRHIRKHFAKSRVILLAIPCCVEQVHQYLQDTLCNTLQHNATHCTAL